ncbi:MAG: bifunctional UDP-N-acetylmuramoyl-tripeptide:D-alanyl-D-alanine ligase/alanine racemase, partial [Salinivirgaceae bacterium]|nr:bifunctional UDP-N-acetylmuramoyl-tripeptide:D-alanyl-D-alanine ligase/alanine racemase [Salinivirgaceae bacterium]
MASYSIGDIAAVIGGKLTRGSGGNVSHILIDSRKVVFARESLFFALKGTRNDGHRFIPELYKAGVRNFVVDNLPQSPENYQYANFIVVEDTLKALHQLVSWHRSKMTMPVVGITGSNGKTIVKEWACKCLAPEKLIARNPKSYNSQIGVPLSVWLLQPDNNLGIFEAGISQPGEMDALENIIKPDIGIFTNIGDAHQENFTSIEQKLNEKLKLFKNVKVLIFGADNQLVREKIKATVSPETKLFTWGTMPDVNLYVESVDYQPTSATIHAMYNNERFAAQIPFADKASVENALQVWSLMLVFGYDNQLIIQRLATIEPIAMRLELKEGNNNCSIINDSYNCDMESLRIALDYLSVQNQHPQKILILSDIEQSGYTKSDLYHHIAVLIRQKNVDRLIGIGSDIRSFSNFFDLRKDFFASTQDFLDHFDFSKIQNSSVLLKGARSFGFERISSVLQKQSHQTVMSIDLSAMEHNLNYFKSLLKPTTEMCCMLKAFAYGSGTHEIANLCQYQRVAMIAVAFADEGVELRRDGIHIPILVLNPERESFAQMIEYRLEPEIYNYVTLSTFNQAVLDAGQTDYPIHLKLDTGMHRSGFMPDDTDNVIEAIRNSKGLKIKTIFSHLATADEYDQDDYTLSQLNTFETMSSAIMAQMDYPIKRHILNSAGIERFADKWQYDMVRLGIGLYGLSVAGAQLQPIATLTSSLAQIKHLKAGTTVGYSRRGKLTRDSEIATVPIGYADGLRRCLGNGNGKLWYKGHLVPIVGNICMDICMVDVTGLDAHEGDPVEIFGKNLPITQVAEWMNTIPYEVLTGISRRVKRTYQYE